MAQNDAYAYRIFATDISELASPALAEHLDKMGREGWQLVTSVSHERHGYSHEVHLFFMRRIAGENGARS